MLYMSRGVMTGSSPLARGTRESRLLLMASLRLIPARAGNTTLSMVAGSLWPAHPRSRGEHVSHHHTRQGDHGSSPLARGTLTGFVSETIPNAAHPRSRGEHEFGWAIADAANGSSPLARGTRRLSRLPRQPRRLIPARAGNTTVRTLTTYAVSAHPRSRGEHSFLRSRASFAAGSSPLARGTPFLELIPQI